MSHTRMLVGKIHCCHVTGADLNYSGSVSIDTLMLEACGFLPNQEVQIWNVTNGNRFSTYVIPAESEPGSGEITLNGSAARQVAIGDKLILAAYANVPTDRLYSGGYVHRSHVALVENPENQVLKQFYTEVYVTDLDSVPASTPSSRVQAIKLPQLGSIQRMVYIRHFLKGY